MRMSEAIEIVAASIEHLPHMCSRKQVAEFLDCQPEYVSRLNCVGRACRDQANWGEKPAREDPPRSAAPLSRTERAMTPQNATARPGRGQAAFGQRSESNPELEAPSDVKVRRITRAVQR